MVYDVEQSVPLQKLHKKEVINVKSVAVCGSAKRAKKEILEFIEELRRRGVIVFAPILLIAEENFQELSAQVKKAMSAGLTLHHFHQIQKADVCYIYNLEGYIGPSVTMEIAYACAKDKPIYTKEKDTAEPCRSVLVDDIVPDIESLMEKLR